MVGEWIDLGLGWALGTIIVAILVFNVIAAFGLLIFDFLTEGKYF